MFKQDANKYEEMLNLLKKTVTHGRDSISYIIGQLDVSLKFWKGCREDTIQMINHPDFRNQPRFFEFNCITLRRILELQKLPYSEIDKIANFIELDSELMSMIESYIHERKDFISKDIIRERKRK